MAAEAWTRTNQSLHFAGQALTDWRELAQNTALDALARQRYQGENTLFHLYRGLLGLLHEVAAFYRWSLPPVSDVEHLLFDPGVQALVAPEWAEVIELAREKGTWLQGLLVAWADLMAAPVTGSSAQTRLIASDAGVASRGWSLALATEALNELKALVNRHRELLQEW